MKKALTLIAVLATVCSCGKKIAEVENGMAYLDLGLSQNDEVNVTKAGVTTVTDLSKWTVVVTPAGGDEAAYTGLASALMGKAITPGDYTIEVYNYADDAAAAEAESGFGAARYSGTIANQTLNAGVNNVNIACGRAKNARFKVTFDSSFTGICSTDDYSLTTEVAPVIAFNKGTADKLAYRAAESTVKAELHYTYNGTPKNPKVSFTMGAAATWKNVNITANDNGTISISISYDDTFTEVGSETITIDAATGNKL